MGQPANVVAASVCARRFLALAMSLCRVSCGSRSILLRTTQRVPRGNLAHDKTFCCLSLQASAQDATDR